MSVSGAARASGSIHPDSVRDNMVRREVNLHRILRGIEPAITSGIVRARHGAVQGSALRSDRARCARLARVRAIRTIGGARRARDLDGAASAGRTSGDYVMAGTLSSSCRQRSGFDGQA
jgi:hypothetical protein